MSTFKVLVKSTDSRSEFNRAYKRNLEHSGKIRCDRCRYHKGENLGGKKWYGGYPEDGIRFPNWKLVSKNKKQWMKKPIKIVEHHNKYSKKIYYDVEFPACYR